MVRQRLEVLCENFVFKSYWLSVWFDLAPNNKWLSLSQLVVDLIEYDSPKLFDQMFLDIVRQDKFDITNGGCAQRYVLPLIPENEVSLFCLSLKPSISRIKKVTSGSKIFYIKSISLCSWQGRELRFTVVHMPLSRKQ